MIHTKEADLSILRAIRAKHLSTIGGTRRRLMTGPGDKHRDYACDSKIYRIYNSTTYKVVERRNLTFVERPFYWTVTLDVQSPLDEIKIIDYATEVVTLTSL